MSRSREYQIIWKVRRLFRTLAAASEALLAPLDLRARDRAVLEFLYAHTQMTVPQISRRFQVSRQHIQMTVNVLLEKGLVAARANPDHQRSPLIALTPEGCRVFESVMASEDSVIGDLFAGLGAGNIDITDATLGTLLERVAKRQRQEQ